MKIKNLFRCVLTAIVWLASAHHTFAVSYTLTVAAQGSGSVTKNPANATYPPGVVVTVTATPNAGNYFTGWSGDTNGTVNPLNVTMNGNYVITGNFLAFPTYPLTLTTNGQGSIVLNPASASYTSNSLVTATATPASGWVFAGWAGSAAGATNPLSFTMNSSNSLTGNFAQLPAFDVPPMGVTNSPGSTVSLTAHAVGAVPLAYQWYFNSAMVAGATNGTLVFTNIQFAAAGSYRLTATNNYGNATSSVALVVLTNGFTNPVSVCDEPSLRAAMAAGGWIRFGCNGIITLTNTLIISNSVILDASLVSVKLSGGSAVRLFYVMPGASLSVTNLTLADGVVKSSAVTNPATTDGGAIFNDAGTVNLSGCTLSNNCTTNTFYDFYSGLRSSARGGAIFNNGTLVSSGTLFSQNFAQAVTEVNSAAGGAIYTMNGNVTLIGCSFNGNSCNSYHTNPAAGGALCAAAGSVLATNCTFNSNSAQGWRGSSLYTLVNIAGEGGAVALLGGVLVVNQSQFLNNFAQGGSENGFGGPGMGGAIYSAGTANIASSLFFNNRATPFFASGSYSSSKTTQDYKGGAIFNGGLMILNGCCICSNLVRGTDGVNSQSGVIAAGSGLGAGLFNAGQLNATNCTVALNTALGGFGYIFNGDPQRTNGNAIGAGVFNCSNATAVFMNVTIASNLCNTVGAQTPYHYVTNGFSAGDQIANVSGTVRLHNSLLGYAGTNGNTYGSITDDGYNISSDGSAAFASGSSYNFTDPKLAALADNGGPTLTMAPLSNSPAIDFGDSSGAPNSDQRGRLRPFGDGVDMGAVEYGSIYSAPSPMNLNLTGSTPSLQLNFTASPPFTYHLQSSTNLTAWTDVETIGAFSSPSNITRTISPSGSAKKFYRVWYQ